MRLIPQPRGTLRVFKRSHEGHEEEKGSYPFETLRRYM
jgi:hypothetical protein